MSLFGHIWLHFQVHKNVANNNPIGTQLKCETLTHIFCAAYHNMIVMQCITIMHCIMLDLQFNSIAFECIVYGLYCRADPKRQGNMVLCIDHVLQFCGM